MDWLDKLIRKAGGYKQVAETAGISEFHLRNIGSGRRTAGTDAVAKLKAVFPRVSDRQWMVALAFEATHPARRHSA